jgi:YD repeat-containing protein
MSRKLLRIVATLVLILVANLAIAQHHSSSANSELDQYVEQVSELSSRARANVYFANPQSMFRGVQVNFVNVGTGNLTFLRRDLVASGRIPLVFARVYDSSGKGSIDFGPGWTLSAAESIILTDSKAHLLTENGSIIDFVKLDEASFGLEKDYPSDYLDLRLVDATTLQANLLTGFTKQFQLIGDAFRLVKVTDRNGNEVRLSYSKGLLNKIENANHSISILRNARGRILSAQDDQDRKIQFAFDAQGRLVEVDDLGGNAWTYSYNDDGKLKAAKDPLQRLNFSVFFDDNARVRRLQLPFGIIQFNYDDAAHSTTVLDRKSLVSRFFQNVDGITTRVVNPLGEETAIVLDDSRDVLSLSRNGSVLERMEYDQQHRITARHSTLESGTVDRTYSYDPSTGQLASIHASTGQDQIFAYDAGGNLTSASLVDGVHKYGYSGIGDLASFSTPATTLALSSDADGLIAGLTEAKNANTIMKYKAGGELDSVIFSDGKSAKYEFQPSGLRANLTYKDKRRVEYTYDPAGNLTSTKVFDAKGKQIAGQVLTLDESYQLTQQATFDRKIVKFAYDKNGNLTEIREGESLTRFEYDSLNRLVAVVTPDGQRLTYEYKSGEHSLVEEYQHAKAFMLDRRDTGLTFGAPAEILSSRPLTGLLGTLRFSESLGTFQLANSNGDEIVTPEQAVEQPLEKLNIIADGTQLQNRQAIFNRPFNPMFIPAEYATINCCPMCIINPARCANCDPNPPDPSSITSMDPNQEDLGSTSFQVTFTGTFSGSVPMITFDKAGISVTIQTHNTFGIGATFNITNASVGNYVVTVKDTGGSPTANLTLLPFINSIDSAMGLVGNSIPVTISGKGFGTAPTLTLGGGITASNISASDTQISATLNIPASAAGGDQSLTVTNQGFSTQGDTFFVQVPTFFAPTNYNAPIISGCASPGNGFFADLTYQLTAQDGSPITMAGLTPQEHVTLNGAAQFFGFRPFATPLNTPSGGVFDDTPLGSCLTTNPPGQQACADLVQTFNIVVPTSSGPTTYPITTQTTRRDCSFGQRVTVNPGGVFTAGTVN